MGSVHTVHSQEKLVVLGTLGGRLAGWFTKYGSVILNGSTHTKGIYRRTGKLIICGKEITV
jgi:hypothetical protein